VTESNSSPPNPWIDYEFAAGTVAAATAICFLLYFHFELTNLVMVYLLGTLIVASRGRRGPAALASALSVLCFDFFFVPPRFRFSVSDTQYFWTFAVMFTAAMIISHLTVRLREEADAAREHERRSVWLMEKAKKAELDVESERMRSSLLSAVSHDLRTPLAVMVGSASTLLESWKSLDDQKAEELLRNIQNEGERLTRLVQNLLEATRLEAGEVRLNKGAFHLDEVVGNAIERVEPILEGRMIHGEVPEDLPAIPIDGVLVEQVFVNLLENAVRHTPERSPIDISARVEGEVVKVCIGDRGPGLKENELERVFDKFYHSPGSPGAGLGLAICRAIVRAHGGLIWAENRAVGGAQFCFTLPLST